MLQIPLQSIPSQSVSVVLAGQNVRISLYQKDSNLFVNVSCNDVTINSSVLALNRNPIIRQPYNGFSGQLMFRDTQGTSDPNYDGFSGRYQLMYLTDAEYAQL
ncbi:hypothetical protein UFOVP150_13 [uncultured Caudovirales phage]|uniref:Cyanophage baseplate Pam3 plug gp18 domain-containing protein n=1 Tax=uncultured Caudovirales phage TaxID=2100421 RepID=A0A6J7W7V1_9CAUD|nr:hypothetical protein UFOVP150_13 [uncultured Caudovirales phage]